MARPNTSFIVLSIHTFIYLYIYKVDFSPIKGSALISSVNISSYGLQKPKRSDFEGSGGRIAPHNYKLQVPLLPIERV